MSQGRVSTPVRTPAAPHGAGRPPAARGPARGTARTGVLGPSVGPGSRLPAVLACGVLMLATLMAVLLLNIALSRGSYADHDLTERQSRLAEQEQALQERLAAAQAPGALDARARALGMVPVKDPGYLRLSDGAVLGDPQAATAPATAPAPTAPAPATPVVPAAAPTPVQASAPTQAPAATAAAPPARPTPTSTTTAPRTGTVVPPGG